MVFPLLSPLLLINLWGCKASPRLVSLTSRGGWGREKRRWTLVAVLHAWRQSFLSPTENSLSWNSPPQPSLLPSFSSRSVSSPALSLSKMTSPPTSLGKLRTSDENSHKFPPNSLSFLWIITQTFFLPAHLRRNFPCHIDRLTPSPASYDDGTSLSWLMVSVFPPHQLLVQFLNTCSNLLIQKEINMLTPITPLLDLLSFLFLPISLLGFCFLSSLNPH